MTIGEVASRTGLRASAIRFYEREGLLPKPIRSAGQRRYTMAILDRIAVLERAKACGFTLAEIRILFDEKGRHSIKWRQLADKKIAELDIALERIAAMKNQLRANCQCATADECGQCLRKAKRAAFQKS